MPFDHDDDPSFTLIGLIKNTTVAGWRTWLKTWSEARARARARDIAKVWLGYS